MPPVNADQPNPPTQACAPEQTSPIADAETWNHRYRQRPALWSIDPSPYLVRFTGPLHPGRALEFGAGEGADARWLARRGWTVTAVDFAEIALQRADAIAIAQDLQVSWQVADLRRYQPTGTFDLVYMSYVHPAPADRHHILTTLTSALAPGGMLLVIGHDRCDFGRGHGGPPDPARHYTADELRESLTDIQLLYCTAVARPLPTPVGDTTVDTIAWGRKPRKPTSPERQRPREAHARSHLALREIEP